MIPSKDMCCMCPAGRKDEREGICPGIPGTPHPKPTKCRFANVKEEKHGKNKK